MKVIIGSDHLGYSYKDNLIGVLLKNGHEIADVGIHHHCTVEYPDIAVRAVEKLLAGDYERAVLIGGSGMGLAMAANKIRGAYAAACYDLETTKESIVCNNCNVLCLGTQAVDKITAEELTEFWLKLKFDPEGEFNSIAAKIKNLENGISAAH